VTATERLYANRIEWAANAIRVDELPGLASSVAADPQVTLTFTAASSVPTLHAGDVLFDRSAEGYVRKVVSFATSGVDLIIQTDPGTLQDLATGGFFGVRNEDDGMQTMSGGSECNPANWSGNWTGAYLGIPAQEFSIGSSSVTSVGSPCI
jgi:hypothetical protein